VLPVSARLAGPLGWPVREPVVLLAHGPALLDTGFMRGIELLGNVEKTGARSRERSFQLRDTRLRIATVL
jgi:hypothetical protein